MPKKSSKKNSKDDTKEKPLTYRSMAIEAILSIKGSNFQG